MLESIHDYMQVGIVSFMAYPEIIKGEGPVLQTISEILEDPFFTAIEVTCIQDDSIRREAKTLLGKSGKIVGFGAQPPLLIFVPLAGLVLLSRFRMVAITFAPTASCP